MLEVKNGQVYYNGKLTKDPLHIGWAFIDFAEEVKKWKQKDEFTST